MNTMQMMNTIKELRKDEVLIINVGLGGCAIGQALHFLGYSCLFVNSATGDLNNLIDVDDRDTLHYKGADGAGGVRAFGKEFAEKNIEKIFERIEKQYNSCKYIFVSFSTGGGTGAGGGTYIVQELYKRYSPFSIVKQNSMEVIPVKDRHIGCIAILPSQYDDINKDGYVNALECYNEIEQLVEAKMVNSVFLLDNEKMNRLEINKTFAKDFDDLITITSRTDGTGKGIDSGDLVNALSGHGYVYISSYSVAGDGLNITGVPYMPKFIRNDCHAILATADIEKECKSDMIMHNFKKHFSPADSISKIGYVISEEIGENNNANRVYGFGLNLPQSVKLQIQEQYNKEVSLKQDSVSPEAKVNISLSRGVTIQKEETQQDIIATTPVKTVQTPQRQLSAREINLLKRAGRM